MTRDGENGEDNDQNPSSTTPELNPPAIKPASELFKGEVDWWDNAILSAFRPSLYVDAEAISVQRECWWNRSLRIGGATLRHVPDPLPLLPASGIEPQGNHAGL